MKNRYSDNYRHYQPSNKKETTKLVFDTILGLALKNKWKIINVINFIVVLIYINRVNLFAQSLLQGAIALTWIMYGLISNIVMFVQFIMDLGSRISEAISEKEIELKRIIMYTYIVLLPITIIVSIIFQVARR